MTYLHDMNYDSGEPKAPRVSEPVQVYLHPGDQDRLKRLTYRLGTNKSDVLRRGLDALERQLTDPEDHPALRIIGLGASDADTLPAADPAREHDPFLTDSEVTSWGPTPDESSGT